MLRHLAFRKISTRFIQHRGCLAGAFLLLCLTGHSLSASGGLAVPPAVPSLEDIMTGVEERYAGIGFSARFEQTSTIKAMAITDTASGQITVKRPGKMRWVYEEPERQLIVTDGRGLWVHKPDENQVMTGSFPTFFGDGKGASFLSDMKLVREKFGISLQGRGENGEYILTLVPEKKELEITVVHLLIAAGTFDILRITTHNVDGDETRIELQNIRFHDQLDDGQFTFQIPEDADVLLLE